MQLSIDGTPLPSRTLVQGSATFTVPNPSAGAHALHAVYAAQGTFGSSFADGTLMVGQASSTTTVSAASGVYNGAMFAAAFSVSGAGKTTGAPSLNYYNNTTATDLGTSAPSSAGDYTVTATYAGDLNHLGSSSSANFTIQAATLTYAANPASRLAGAANPSFNGSVTGFVLNDTLANATTGTLAFGSPATTSSSAGSYAINGSGLTANNGNYVFAQAAGNATALTITPATTANLQTTLASQSSVALEVAPSQATSVINAVNALTAPSSPVTITLDLTSGSYTGLVASPPPNVTLIISGAGGSVSFVGNSPALTVAGNVIVESGVTFSNATNTPTILVTSGTLTLRGATVQESTAGNQPAILITGGTVDLGTVADPGNNTFNINGPGRLLRNTSANPVSAVGNTFQNNGVGLTDVYRIADLMDDGLDTSGRGLVTFAAERFRVAGEPQHPQRSRASRLPINAPAAGTPIRRRQAADWPSRMARPCSSSPTPPGPHTNRGVTGASGSHAHRH